MGNLLFVNEHSQDVTPRWGYTRRHHDVAVVLPITPEIGDRGRFASLLPKELVNEIMLYLRESGLKEYLAVKQINRHYFNLPALYYDFNGKMYRLPIWSVLKYIESMLGHPLSIHESNNDTELVIFSYSASSSVCEKLKTVFDDIGLSHGAAMYIRFKIDDVPKIIYRISQL